MMTAHGEEPAVVELACDWAYQNDRLEEALDFALLLLELAPGSVETWTNLMAIRVDLRQWEAMAGRCRERIARFPLDPLLYYYRGLALGETRQHRTRPSRPTRADSAWCWTTRCWKVPWRLRWRRP